MEGNRALRPRLAIVDMAVERKSPAGSCVLEELRGLAQLYDLTVFSNRCDVAGDYVVKWIRVPLPTRPNLLRYLVFHSVVGLRVAIWQMSGGRAALFQTTQGQLPGADVVYAHFCHRAYLKGAWTSSTARGARRWARWLNHKWNAWFERRAILQATTVVVPSLGLERELSREYPSVASRIVRIPNPVDIARFEPESIFDRGQMRLQLGVGQQDLALSFMALGDFSRKGLGLLIEALGRLSDAHKKSIKFVVIGGQPSEIESFRELSKRHGVADRLVFVGMQSDVRPYLWLSDAFVFPSSYEIFSLAILQAAAAHLPVLVSDKLYGAEEFVVDGNNGWVVERSVEGVQQGLERIVTDRIRLADMAEAAAASVFQYSKEAFAQRWRSVYSGMLSDSSAPEQVSAIAEASS